VKSGQKTLVYKKKESVQHDDAAIAEVTYNDEEEKAQRKASVDENSELLRQAAE